MASTGDLVLVTGANGWLGRRVVRALTQGNPEMGAAAAGGRSVRALVMPGEDARDLLAIGVDIVAGDVRDPVALGRFFAGTQDALLIHLAGVIHPRRGVKEFTQVNVDGVRATIEAAGLAGVRRAVVMSSNSPIGVSRYPYEVFDEQSPYRPYMGYGRSKEAMERWLLDWSARGRRPEITIIRAPWFYGPEQPRRQTRFFSMIKAGRFPLFGRGENRRSMGYVDSLAFGILLAAAAPVAAGRVYWLADERPYPMTEIIDTVREVLRDDFRMAVRPSTIRAPAVIADMARLADWTLQKAGLYHQEIHVLSEMNLTIACSIERAQQELGYKPLVDLREGMRRSVAWCLENGIAL
jgi:nucleoside-diphosphate-sugar epimerase